MPWPCQYLFPYFLYLISTTWFHAHSTRAQPTVPPPPQNKTLQAEGTLDIISEQCQQLIAAVPILFYSFICSEASHVFPLVTDPRLLSPTALMTGADLARVYLVGGVTWKPPVLSIDTQRETQADRLCLFFVLPLQSFDFSAAAWVLQCSCYLQLYCIWEIWHSGTLL